MFLLTGSHINWSSIGLSGLEWASLVADVLLFTTSTHCWYCPVYLLQNVRFCLSSFSFVVRIFSRGGGGGGVLTLTWYTSMCLPFGVLFCEIKFGIAIGGVHQRRRSPNYINWVYFGQINSCLTEDRILFWENRMVKKLEGPCHPVWKVGRLRPPAPTYFRHLCVS